jgi:branched-chain amino acid transport system permease protein
VCLQAIRENESRFVYCLVSGEAVIFNVKGGIGTLAGPLLGVGVFHSGGVIFVAMVILMPRGLLGFARNWLNS